MTVPANVTRGAAYLDERLPGWRNVIDADSLMLENGCHCVIGQLFGNYDDGLTVLALSNKEAARLGFYTAPRQRWDRLTDAWRAVLHRG